MCLRFCLLAPLDPLNALSVRRKREMTVITEAHVQRCGTAGCLRWRYALSRSAPSLLFYRTAGDIYSIYYVIIFCMVMVVMMWRGWIIVCFCYFPYFEFYFVINLFACLYCCFFVCSLLFV